MSFDEKYVQKAIYLRDRMSLENSSRNYLHKDNIKSTRIVSNASNIEIEQKQFFVVPNIISKFILKRLPKLSL